MFWMEALTDGLSCYGGSNILLNGFDHVLQNPQKGKQRTVSYSICNENVTVQVLCAMSSSSKFCALLQPSNVKKSFLSHFSVNKRARYPTPYIPGVIHTVTISIWSYIWAENYTFARNWLHNSIEGQRIESKEQKQSVVFAWEAFYTAYIIHSRRTWA